MPRPLRPDVDDGWYHVMNRGIDHADVFFDDRDRIRFGQLLGEVYDLFAVETHAYCLMDNHFHLLLHCPHGDLSVAMQRLGSVHTRHVNDRLGRDGALFRGRFHSRMITTDQHLVATCRYIHRNALDLPGVDRADCYRWSSHRTYLGHRVVPPWIRTGTVLSYFGHDPIAFDRFVSGDQHPGSARELTSDDLDDLIEAITMIVHQNGIEGGRRIGAVARSAVLGWASTAGAVGDQVLMEAFQLDTSTSLRMAKTRGRRQLARDPALGASLERALGLIFIE